MERVLTLTLYVWAVVYAYMECAAVYHGDPSAALSLNESSLSQFTESESAHDSHYLGLLCPSLWHGVHPCCFHEFSAQAHHTTGQ